MRLGVPKESKRGETRVAATPKTVEQLIKLGYDVVVEAGAGRTPLHFTEDPGDAPQGIADVLAACPEESA